MGVGLYIHIPYCKKKCDYCAFYSLPSSCVSDTYISSLCKEILSYQKENVSIDTVFIGGGTPSLLSLLQLKSLFFAIHSAFIIQSDAEITIECNPESINYDFLFCAKELGVNRISIGVQSLNNNVLRAIGRLHTAEQAIGALQQAVKLFHNVNVDFMVGLPMQSISSVQQDITALIAQGITHISVYSLIVEEDTPIYKRIKNGCIIPSADDTVDMYDLSRKLLTQNCFYRYEISNFARSGFECKHNSNCWQLMQYIGVGVSAHSYYNKLRYYNEDNLEKYISTNGMGDRVSEGENTLSDRKKELLMLALRTEKGLSYARWAELFFTDFREEFSDKLQNTVIKKTCLQTTSGIAIREEYFYISNSIIELFFE